MFKIRSSKNIKDDNERRKSLSQSKTSILNSIEDGELSLFSEEFKNSLIKKDNNTNSKKTNNGFSMQRTGGKMINPDYM